MDPAFSRGAEHSGSGQVPLDLAAREWKTASSLLATSMERYINACHRLNDAYPNSTYVLNYTSSIWDVFDDMDKELDRLESYEHELRQVRVDVSQVRNRSPRLASIMVLPRELLTYIFELVLLAEYWDYVVPDFVFPDHSVEPLRHPDTLSIVCTYWHQVVTNTPSLWAHIDLVVSGEYKKIHYTRASRLIRRAAGVPLIVRIHNPAPSESKDVRRLTNWLAPVADQICSLDISTGLPSKQTLNAVLQCWLEHGSPGTVKELGLKRFGRYHEGRKHSHRFIEGNVSDPSPNSWQLGVSQRRFDAFFRPIEILRLEGLFPHWHGQAYHGLVHLRLYTGRIKEVELINLLSQNPQLRTLSLDIEVLNTRPRDTAVTPIRLPQLEILSMFRMVDATKLWSILRLIAPGSGPLRMSFGIDPTIVTADFTQSKEIRAFIQRSNITAIWVNGTYTNGTYVNGETNRDIWFPQTLSSFPQLRTLALGNYSLVQNDTVGYDSVCSSLRELCLIDCNIDIDLLEQLLDTHSVQVLRLAGCNMLDGLPQSSEEVQDELSAYVSNVKCHDFADATAGDPYLNWHFFMSDSSARGGRKQQLEYCAAGANKTKHNPE
ncbi:hypothetical protein FRC09_014418 [Ceratobasidium sp. 395]|nr:hypothetical protein FRC09_014418 [Ceratobasidium sp. 395]